MKAIVKVKPETGAWMIDVPVPKIGESDLLIKVKQASICGTDVHLYKWDEWARKTLPVGSTIGHEFVGEIVEMGSAVKGFSLGQRVSAEGHITCGHCRFCQTGKRVLCPNTIGIGVNRHGCFADYVAVPQENIFVVPDDISDDMACIYDPLGNTVHTALSADLVGKDVLITGAGPIGLMAIAVAKQAGAKRVVITDVNPYRLDLAKKMQADGCVNVATESLEEQMETLGITSGFDVVLEMSGSPHVMDQITTVSAHGASIILLGLLPAEAMINWHQVIFKMLTLKGIYGREIFNTWYQATNMLQSGLDITPVITHRFSADEFEKGFEVMLAGQSGKVILDWA